MVCKDEALAKRLQTRPRWREPAEPETLSRMVEFNNWLKANASTTQPPMRLLDTTDLSVEQSVERVADWVRSHEDK